jgi:hypothetical protein
LRPTLVLLAIAVVVGACKAPPITKADCFGDIAYSFVGWTADIDAGAPAGEEVFAMITADEVVLTATPAAPDGSYRVIRGRGLCVARDGLVGGVSKRAFGQTRTVEVMP